jgi:acetyl esterase/lipase
MLDVSTASFAYLPLQIVAYSSPKFRQTRDWSYRQALTNSILKAGLKNYTAFKIKWPLSLKGGSDRDCFINIQPASPQFYISVATDRDIKPETIGATWYPNPMPSGAAAVDNTEKVILHFHGGSYVLGDGRPSSTSYIANTLLENTPCSYILCAQYRLACRSNGRFPAQLQDAISTYAYMLHTLQLPASRIVVSGDSSGGHLALALLRYISEFDDETLLPAPRCMLFWSPWCDVPEARTPEVWKQNKNYKTEFVPSSFPQWGARSFLGGLEISGAVEKYVVPLRHPFLLPSPVLVVTGSNEVLFEEQKELAARFEKILGNEKAVELVISEGTPHDVLMIAWLLGFKKEAKECAERAGSFIEAAGRTAEQ